MLVSFLYTFCLFNRMSYICINESIVNGRSYFNENISIYDCFFSRLSQLLGYGGVIYVSWDNLSMYVTHCMFYQCLSDHEGGAIYYNSINSSLRMICANKCCASGCHFAYLGVGASNLNQVGYLSMSCCSSTNDGWFSLILDSGNQNYDNSNSSMNVAEVSPGITIYPPGTFTSSYCTFSNNHASLGHCFYFSSDLGIISSTNIVHNYSPLDKGLVSIRNGNQKILFSIIQENHLILFNVYSGSLEIMNSFILHLGIFSTSIPVSTGYNNSLTKKATYQIQFFNSHYCNAEIPSEIIPKVSLVSPEVISLLFIILLIICIAYTYRFYGNSKQDVALISGIKTEKLISRQAEQSKV